ncbi:MAG TPA: PH domain-containing protein [Streptosporangiaceae bacterium]|nr:PH domain-containing protein [Streptosporangiaceae bacterium]
MDREAFRLAPPLILWWVWVVFALANIADFAIQGASARFAIVVSAILATVTGLAYALAWRPRVIAGPDGLTIVNPFRDHHVPWTAIQAVDTGEWVLVHYASRREADQGSGPISTAASQAISCWALYISARTKRRTTRVARMDLARAGLTQAGRDRAGLTGSAGFAGSAGSAGSARSASRRRSAGFGRPSLPGRLDAAAGRAPGYGASSRLPEEARYLASLPAAKAIAVRLDARAARERARARPADAAAGAAAPGGTVTVRWAWPPAAAVALPALVLVLVAAVS